MTIQFYEDTHTFHLRAGDASYLLQVHKGYLAHRYFGKKLSRDQLAQPLVCVSRSFSPNPDAQDESFSLDTLPQEYPTYGQSDFRMPAIEVQTEHGSTVVDLRYVGHRLFAGKPRLTGLPSTYIEQPDEADTLEIDLEDPLTHLRVVLRYTAFAAYSVIARSVLVINGGTQTVQLKRVLSAALDLPDDDYELTQLSGAWARERHVERRRLTTGAHLIESRRGTSSHQQNPFLALARTDATETTGDVMAIQLVYSGQFLMGVEVDQFHTARVVAGINPFDFNWQLLPGDSFQAPEAILAHSASGYGGLSRTLHKLYRTRLARGKFRDQVRPVLINNWEATYFNFDSKTLVELGQSAAELGVELFVLDDGWFGRRDNDHSSLGDWVVDTRKLPAGLADVAQQLAESGLAMGIWFEPEMISPDSDLYRAHPDWCLHVPGRGRSVSRHQLVLDYSRFDVPAGIVARVSAILPSAHFGCVKWESDRIHPGMGSALLPPERQRETAHRYVLGLYEVLETMTEAFPDVLFESCSGGGGRFDLGMLHYMPQVWTSDNTDAIARLPIQFGTSLAYPASAMGAHVSATPNHQVERSTPLATRGLVAMMGNLGYELDVRKMDSAERAQIKEQIAQYKAIRHLVFYGDLHRLRDPQKRGDAAWMYVSEERDEAYATFVRVLAQPNPPLDRLRLYGLAPERVYHVTLEGAGEFTQTPIQVRDCIAGGDELMAVGLIIPYLAGDFRACAWRLCAL